MRKAILAMLVLLVIQLNAWSGSDSVIVEAPAGIKAAALAAQFGGKVVDEIPGTSYFLMKVPSAAALVRHRMGASIEMNEAVTLRPAGRLGILKTPDSGASQWYAGQPAMKLIRADKALAYSKGRRAVVAP